MESCSIASVERERATLMYVVPIRISMAQCLANLVQSTTKKFDTVLLSVPVRKTSPSIAFMH